MSHVSGAGLIRLAERRDAILGTHDQPVMRPHRVAAGVDDPWLMCRRGLSCASDGDNPDRCNPRCTAKHRMAGMRMAFAASGGLRSVGELALGNERRKRIRFAQIARWIATREIIGFMWQAEPWVPMFQFDPGPHLRPRQALQPLFALLVPLYDPWDMAHWFARPNHWLSGRRPVDEWETRLSAVLDVAHLEHFIAAGQTAQQHPDAPGKPVA